MTAFRATFSDIKNIKTRQVVQLIFEIPVSDFDAAYEVLGGMPDPAKERWFGIAAIKTQRDSSPGPAAAKPQPVSDKPQAGAKRSFRDLPASQQAALRCNDPSYWAFLREEQDMVCASTDGAANAVRLLCSVNSRSEFDTNHTARVIWHQLDRQYQAWLAKERVGA